MAVEFCTTLNPALGRSIQVSLREELSLADGPNGDLLILSAAGKLTFKGVTVELRQAFGMLAKGTTFEAMVEMLSAEGGAQALTRLYLHFEQLSRRGLISHTVVEEGEPLATIVGTGRAYSFQLRDLDIEQSYVLSRFAFCRRYGKGLVLESPLGQARILFHNPRAAGLISLICEPHSLKQLSGRRLGMGEEATAGLLQLLLNADAVSEFFEGSVVEDDNPTLAQWSFHDLLFHSRSRYGRHNDLFGATFRHLNRIEPLPAVKKRPEGENIPLYRPDLEQLKANDPPLSEVVELRTSVYNYGPRPITLDQLGEFLFRVARVRSLDQMQVRSMYSDGQGRMEVSSRPYPAGGKCYELEFYLVVDQCDGLPSGLYHYEPLDHCLTRIAGRNQHVEALLQYASVAAPSGRPQVMVTLAARFQRVSWKYDAIAYATTLKHVGVVYQNMYLAATAMGLGPCALGSGDSDLFATAADLDYYAETSVGEFMLGSTERGRRVEASRT